MAKSWTEELPVELSDTERRQRGEDMSAKCLALYEFDEGRKEDAKEAKAKSDRMAAEVRSIARIMHTGQEDRPVAVHEEFRVELATVEVIREDTGEVVRSRAMTGSELSEARQGRLALFSGGQASDA